MNLLRKRKPKPKVKIYSKQACHLCDEAKELLMRIQKRFPFELTEIDITRDAKLHAEFKEQIPVIFINGKKTFKFRVEEEELIRKLKRL